MAEKTPRGPTPGGSPHTKDPAMKTPGFKHHPFVWFMVAACLAGSGALRADVEDTVKKSFPVQTGETLAVDLDRGSIEVTGSDATTVEVEVWRKASTESVLERHSVTVEQASGRVNVTGRLEGGLRSWWSNRQLQVRCVVKVPREFNAELKTAGGSITVKNLAGQLKGATAGGSLNFQKVEGPIRGRTSGGSIAVADCVGQVDVETSGGSLNLSAIKGDVKGHTSGGSVKVAKIEGACDVGTSGGGIHVEDVTGKLTGSTSGGSVSAVFSSGPTQDCTLKTSGGGVTLELPGTAGVALDAATSGGSVSSELPVQMTVQGEAKRGRLEGTINGGGPKVMLRSSGGSIRVKKS